MGNFVHWIGFIFLLCSCWHFAKPPEEDFSWPLNTYSISQFFSFKKNHSHFGIDLVAKRGIPVRAVQRGRVIYTGSRLSGYGNTIIIEHPSGWASLYGHLDEIQVKTGVKVKKNEVIGTVGSTGRTTGVHLHFELIRNREPVDPLLYLPKSP